MNGKVKETLQNNNKKKRKENVGVSHKEPHILPPADYYARLLYLAYPLSKREWAEDNFLG